MLKWWTFTVTLTLTKTLYAVTVVVLLAAQVPWWHQAVIVLGGASITGFASIGSAWMVGRRLERPVEAVQQDLHEHRVKVEDHARPPDVRTRTTDTDTD